jgi:hypothetical protein
VTGTTSGSHRRWTPLDVRADAELRITDLLLCALVPLRVLDGPRGIPLNEVACAVLLGLAVLRPRPRGVRLPPVVAVLTIALVGLMAFSGYANDIDWYQRVAHLVLWVGLVWVLAMGKVSLRSAALGFGAGLVAASVSTLFGVTSYGYEGRLTGWFGDPNAAAYFLAVLGVLAVGWAGNRRLSGILLAGLLVAVVLTFSRTGLLAVATAVLWWLAGRRLGIVGGVVVGSATLWLVHFIPPGVRLYGPFADRDGSDQLRERIIAQEHDVLAQAPWYGNGPGQATVLVDGDRFFFHNSYLAVRQEGGWIALLLLLALVAYAFLRLSRASRRGDPHAIAGQAALIALMVSAVTLGEVLLELPAAFAIGFALRTAATLPDRREVRLPSHWRAHGADQPRAPGGVGG